MTNNKNTPNSAQDFLSKAAQLAQPNNEIAQQVESFIADLNGILKEKGSPFTFSIQREDTHEETRLRIHASNDTKAAVTTFNISSTFLDNGSLDTTIIAGTPRLNELETIGLYETNHTNLPFSGEYAPVMNHIKGALLASLSLEDRTQIDNALKNTPSTKTSAPKADKS